MQAQHQRRPKKKVHKEFEKQGRIGEGEGSKGEGKEG